MKKVNCANQPISFKPDDEKDVLEYLESVLLDSKIDGEYVSRSQLEIIKNDFAPTNNRYFLEAQDIGNWISTPDSDEYEDDDDHMIPSRRTYSDVKKVVQKVFDDIGVTIKVEVEGKSCFLFYVKQ